MSTAVNKKRKAEREDTMRVNAVQFELLRDGTAGQCLIDFTVMKAEGGHTDTKIVLPILTAWVDNRHSSICKCHLKTNRQNLLHQLFRKFLIRVGHCEYRRELHFSTDQSGLIRYGTVSDNTYTAQYIEKYESYFIYDSKAKAMAALLDRSSQEYQIGGLSLINLDIVADSVLEELGYERIEPAFGTGVTMWLGNPMRVIDAGVGDTWGRAKEEKRKQNIEGWLKLVADAIDAA